MYMYRHIHLPYIVCNDISILFIFWSSSMCVYICIYSHTLKWEKNSTLSTMFWLLYLMVLYLMVLYLIETWNSVFKDSLMFFVYLTKVENIYLNNDLSNVWSKLRKNGFNKKCFHFTGTLLNFVERASGESLEFQF